MKLNFLINYFCIMFSYLCYTGDLTHGNHTSASIKPLTMLIRICSQKLLEPKHKEMFRKAIKGTLAPNYLSVQDQTTILELFSEKVCLEIEKIKLTIKKIQLSKKRISISQPHTEFNVAKLIEQKNMWREFRTIIKTESRTRDSA